MNLENLKSAYDETRSLERLVDELRELSLLESPGLRLSLQKIDAGVLAAQAAQAFAGVFAERGLRLENNIPAGLPPVSADPGRFLQVVRNLLDNAAKYCPAGSKLSMSAEVEADKRPARLALAIADDGPGVPPAELELIFDRFHRVEKSRSRATGGSGLGLAIVKSIIEAHGGEVRAEQAEPHGLRVKFSLPLA
jgi:signal transduction histidine kinase